MGVRHFSHTGICVSDLARSTAFYRDALGFKQHHRLHFEGEPASTLLQIKDVELDVVYLERDGTVIELLYFPERVESRNAIPREVNRTGLTHFSFNVDQIDQVVHNAPKQIWPTPKCGAWGGFASYSSISTAPSITRTGN